MDVLQEHEANQRALAETLSKLLESCENELVEFKEAKSNFDLHTLGQYFSALSNEASLKNKQYGWLIFGVEDKTHKIVGTAYKDARSLEKLKHDIAAQTTGGITFMDIFELYAQDGTNRKRVVMFKIPAAALATQQPGKPKHPASQPVRGRIGRNSNPTKTTASPKHHRLQTGKQ